jgi:hypothetical protein
MGLFDIIDDVQDFLISKADSLTDPFLGFNSDENDEISEKPCRLKKGDVVYTDRAGGVYQHYGVYIGNKKIIHYASRHGDFGDDICVHETSLGNFLSGGECYTIDFSESYDWGNNRRNRKVTIPGIRGIYQPVDIGATLFGTINTISKIYKNAQYHLYSATETVERAKSKLGESEYNLAVNNCEHFAIWCKTGLSESKQVENVLELISSRPHLPINIVY